jgi:sugar transferase (PEP-CTERM/EpsH1 system associated)
VKQEVLFLSHRIPYPPDKGDKIRSWRILEFLTKRFRVHLGCFADDPHDLQYQEFLESLCESVIIVPLDPKTARQRSLKGFLTGGPLSFQYFGDRLMTESVNALRQKPLVAEIVFSSSMAPYVEKPVGNRKRIVDFCDSDAEKWRAYARAAKAPMSFVYTREAHTLANEETRIANWADASFAVTPDEAAVFNGRPGLKKRVSWFPNGVDTAYFDPQCVEASSATKTDCVFVGAMDYRANAAGVFYFLDRIWPSVRKARPGATFAIVGPNPPASLVALAGQDGVRVTGRVDDVRPWLAGAKLVVAPLRIARGVQNKVLEAMAMAKAVIASPEAMTGIGAPASTAIVASTPEDVASAIDDLLSNEGKRNAMGGAARRHVVERYQWDAALSRFGQTLDALGL